MKIDFSRLNALSQASEIPAGFESVPEEDTPFDAGYEAIYRAAYDFHQTTDERLSHAKAGEERAEIWFQAAERMGRHVAAYPDTPFAAALFAAIWQELERTHAGE